MKLQSLLSALVTASLVRTNSAAFIVRVEVPQAGQLTEQEVSNIEKVKANLGRRDRNLRVNERELDPYWCHVQCRYTVFPYCQIWQPQCYDHRRNLHELPTTATTTSSYVNDIVDSSLFKLRDLVGDECEAEKQRIMLQLESAVTTSTGLDVIHGATMSCFELLDVCAVNTFNLLDSQKDTVVKADMRNGYEICTSLEFSIEAVADACVRLVKFELTGPNGYVYSHTEYEAIFSMFKNVGTDYEGQKLPVGSYNLKVTADNNEELVEFRSFKVVQC